MLTTQRTGQSVPRACHDRTEFQRDYDRIVFSAPFRRLQNKTQVFPLPGSVFVHNRLTHSLEVASVGRSLGDRVGSALVERGETMNGYAGDVSAIVAAACLAHDMGNPPFGHSGEKAISHYFSSGNGREMLSSLTEQQRSDLINFDGNANTFRLLTHTFAGRREGGFALTFPTVASIIKYPRRSIGVKKFGFFQQDEKTFMDVVERLELRRVGEMEFCRYPLAYLVEAAEDIFYEIMDVEDAYRLGILEYDETRMLLSGFFDSEADKRVFEGMERVFRLVSDRHEHINYLRSIAIGRLVDCCAQTFIDHLDEILSGEFHGSLIDHLPTTEKRAMDVISHLAIERIYNHQTVREIELSGFAIMSTLLDAFIQASSSPERYYSQLIKPFVPEQFRTREGASEYEKMLSAVDTVAGMTDIYALDLFKKIKGIGLG